VGNVVKDVTVTPQNFAAPGLSAASATLDNVVNENSTSATITVTPKAGAWEYSIDDSNVATLSQSGNVITVTASHKGSTTVRVKNKSDNTKASTYTITVARDYNGKSVWKYYGYYIAPEDAGSSTWNTSLNATYCANKSGATWFVPSAADWRLILGGTSGDDNASSGVYNEYKSKGVFASGSYYWSTTEYSSSYAYLLGFSSSVAYVGSYYGKSYSRQVRCVSK